MNNCTDCLKPLEQVGTPTAAAFPDGHCSGLKWARNTFLKCPECEGLTLLVELFEIDGKIRDWHYMDLPTDVEHQAEKRLKRS